MSHNLVIVESPAKVKTIKKFLGKNYSILASNGHLRDLPKSQLGIDVNNDYEPKYITIRGKGEILSALKKEAKKADKVYLATDPDREGEAISWHLAAALKIDESKIRRIAFNEITKNAVKTALKQSREIDMDLVNAQQARRILDRIVGYEISPVLWAKIKRGLSAGRVQSVALKIVAEREALIRAFVPEEYWSLEAKLEIKGEKRPLIAKFHGKNDKKIAIGSKEELDKILKVVEGEKFVVADTKTSQRSRKAPFPFITNTLQQEASKVLKIKKKKTMLVAQGLYEGVNIKGKGTIGLITYLRTDSTRISEEAVGVAKEFIAGRYGAEYIADATEQRKSNKKVQDAHEAIRPSDINLTPEEVKASLTRDQLRLYQLIWKRFVASQMKPALYETISVKISAGDYQFNVSTSRVIFQGYQTVYTESEVEKAESNVLVKDLDKNTTLTKKELEAKQHFTQPPHHFTEATLVRALEEEGIGRPSTYAPTIALLLGRRYVVKEDKNLYITEIGEAVNGIMSKSFSNIVDVHFTANMENMLDTVEHGEVQWKEVIRKFYPELDKAVKIAQKELETIKIEDEVTDVLCDKCGRNMVVKYGPYGKFLACPGFPECRNTKTYLEKVGVPCPKCGKEVVLRMTKKGRRYFGCEDGPECDFMSWVKPTKENCPKCGKYLVEKGDKLVCSEKECGYSDSKEKV
jgi:DNA topoisomerase-1